MLSLCQSRLAGCCWGIGPQGYPAKCGSALYPPEPAAAAPPVARLLHIQKTWPLRIWHGQVFTIFSHMQSKTRQLWANASQHADCMHGSFSFSKTPGSHVRRLRGFPIMHPPSDLSEPASHAIFQNQPETTALKRHIPVRHHTERHAGSPPVHTSRSLPQQPAYPICGPDQ